MTIPGSKSARGQIAVAAPTATVSVILAWSRTNSPEDPNIANALVAGCLGHCDSNRNTWKSWETKCMWLTCGGCPQCAGEFNKRALETSNEETFDRLTYYNVICCVEKGAVPRPHNYNVCVCTGMRQQESQQAETQQAKHLATLFIETMNATQDPRGVYRRCVSLDQAIIFSHLKLCMACACCRIRIPERCCEYTHGSSLGCFDFTLILCFHAVVLNE